MARAGLQAPLRRLLDETLPEPQVHRLWRRLEPRLEARPRSELPRLVALALSVFVVTAVALTYLGSPSPEALHLASGGDVPAVIGAATARAVSFDDGSRIEVGQGARLDVLESSDRAFAVALRSGEARFEVVPGGPRSWTVECGPVSVEVVGTRFAVARDAKSVRVEVERGKVLVRGDGVPDRVARLGAGESLVVPLSRASAAARRSPARRHAGTEQPAAARRDRGAGSREPRSRPPGLRPEPPTAAPHASGRGSSDSAESQATVETLLSRADEARRRGRWREAADLLRRVVDEHPDDRRVALAEFSLGRLYLDSLAMPKRAAAHFLRSIDRGLPGALSEDAHARLVEAYGRAGDTAEAARWAAAYRTRYPGGRHQNDVSRWDVGRGR